MLAKSPPANAGPPRYAYTLVEELSDGSHLRDIFNAPSNSEAIARAQGVIEGQRAELWRGSLLICRWGEPDENEPASLREARVQA
jgi:hypothetical protein